jgi:D-galactarolactone isomerase
MHDSRISRRTFLKGAGVVTLAAAGAAHVLEGHAAFLPDEIQVPNSAGTGAPKLKAPANACDCHHHIYDNRFPQIATARRAQSNGRVEDYRLLQKRLGTSRNVVVTPSSYGTGNACTLDALEKFGLATTRGIAVVDTTVTDAELKRLADAGVRGIRFTVFDPGSTTTTVEMIEPLSKRVNELGLHVQIHMRGDQIVASKEMLMRLPSPIVIDHIGRLPQPAGIDYPAFQIICNLIDKGKTWMKLSGAYLDTKVGPPTYADISKVAQAFVKFAPERMVWGSDWPHPTEKDSDKPNDAVLFDLLTAWAPDEATRLRILVDNPAVLYGFAKS